MIAVPQGFRVEPGLDILTLIPPEGPQAGLIRYKERVRPLDRLGMIVRRQLQGAPSFRLHERSEPRRLMTEEGEHAALIELVGHEQAQPAIWILGVVFGDDFYSLTSAFCRQTAQSARYRELVHALISSDSLGLGWRRRRYLYQPPAGFQPYITGLTTEWLAPLYPRDPTAITAWPAEPRRKSPKELCDIAIADVEAMGAVLSRRASLTPFATGQGLRGLQLSLCAERSDEPDRLFRRFLALEDGHYSYTLGLSQLGGSESEAHVAEFLRCAHSLVGCKAPDFVPLGQGASQHWAS